MKGLRYCLCFLLCLIMSGCVLFMRYNFDFRDRSYLFSKNYDPMLEDKFNINGYYILDEPYTDVMFALYPDGTYTYFKFRKDYNYIGKSITNLDSLISGDNMLRGGIYKVVDDTVVVEWYYDGFPALWRFGIEKYEIVDKNTLREFESIVIDKAVKEKGKYKVDRLYHFIPSFPLPSKFKASVKKEKWMWDNKEDWKAYMVELNEYLEGTDAKDAAQ